MVFMEILRHHHHQILWGCIWIVTASVLLAGTFIPKGPSANDAERAMLNAGDTGWMLAATGLVLFMTPGLAFFYGGMVNTHNMISTMIQCFICLGVVSILWIVVGFSLAFGEDAGSFIGNPWTYLWFRNVGTAPNPEFAPSIPFQLYALFQLKFAILTPALTCGGYIERMRFGPFLVYIIFFCLIVYCPVAHWVWHPQGFIRNWGVKDFAGGAVVHMTSGVSALAGAVVVGKRQSFEKGKHLKASNVPYVMLGTGMLWFGWFGFNGGSELAADQTAALAFLNTNTASASAMVMWMIMEGLSGKKPSALGACIGVVIGLVVITPACGYVTVGDSLFMGGFGSMVCYGINWLMHKLPVDDGLDAFASHGVGGALGCILTGVFMADVGVVYGPPGENWKYFGYFWATIVIVGLWAFIWSCIILKVISLVYGLRPPPEEELLGLDETQHGETIYSADYESPEKPAVFTVEISAKCAPEQSSAASINQVLPLEASDV